ncbi:translation initiation factor IF-2-like [Sciurus carolinensis]|uniref:translation initiation factor IF-2-like n=1 Tax=Sciurus carolinensis TaxID=30640 RepID=UPI001FB35156|nr:translation initiation factor IF-2-like [Sciurus carolinensis]
MPEGGDRPQARQASEERTEASFALSVGRSSSVHPRLHLTARLGRGDHWRRPGSGSAARPGGGSLPRGPARAAPRAAGRSALGAGPGADGRTGEDRTESQAPAISRPGFSPSRSRPGLSVTPPL